MTPATLLRDTALAGLVLSLVGGFGGVAFAGAVASGALVSILNLGLLVRLTSRATPEMSALFQARLLLKQVAGAILLLSLMANFPAVPALIGFCSVLLALAARAFLGLAGGTAALSTPEPG